MMREVGVVLLTLDLRHLVQGPALSILAHTNTSKCASHGLFETWVETDFLEESSTNTNGFEITKGGWHLFAGLLWHAVVPLDVALTISIDV